MARTDADPTVRYLTDTTLRSKLVAKLTGLSFGRLHYWHETGLQSAHAEGGRRGVPRLYSWIDYQRLLVVAGLLEGELETTKVRRAVAYLDRLFPGWYRLSLSRYDGEVAGQGSHTHVAVALPGARSWDVIATAGGQVSFRREFEDEADAVGDSLLHQVRQLVQAGPLGHLSEFDDAVEMRPGLNGGAPTVRGRRLEVEFVARAVEEDSAAAVAEAYDLRPESIERLLEFHRRVAA